MPPKLCTTGGHASGVTCKVLAHDGTLTRRRNPNDCAVFRGASAAERAFRIGSRRCELRESFHHEACPRQQKEASYDMCARLHGEIHSPMRKIVLLQKHGWVQPLAAKERCDQPPGSWTRFLAWNAFDCFLPLPMPGSTAADQSPSSFPYWSFRQFVSFVWLVLHMFLSAEEDSIEHIPTSYINFASKGSWVGQSARNKTRSRVFLAKYTQNTVAVKVLLTPNGRQRLSERRPSETLLSHDRSGWRASSHGADPFKLLQVSLPPSPTHTHTHSLSPSPPPPLPLSPYLLTFHHHLCAYACAIEHD